MVQLCSYLIYWSPLLRPHSAQTCTEGYSCTTCTIDLDLFQHVVAVVHVACIVSDYTTCTSTYGDLAHHYIYSALDLRVRSRILPTCIYIV